jgi:hypothetical protein
MYAEHIQVGEEGRPAPGASRISILMPPGEYTVRLTVGDESMEQPLTVLKDPNTAGTEADIADQVAFLRDIREDVVRATEAVERIEALRVQLRNVARFAEEGEVVEQARALEASLTDMQMNLVELRLTGQGQDGVRFAAQLLQKLGYLAGGIDGADFPPTDQQMEVKELLHDQLREILSGLEAFESGPLAEFNGLLADGGVPVIGGA